jgi:hypothetical protein
MSSEEYRVLVLYAERMAQLSADAQVVVMYQQLAKTYRTLARLSDQPVQPASDDATLRRKSKLRRE